MTINRRRYNPKRLEDIECQKTFKTKLREGASALRYETHEGVEEKWERIKTTFQHISENTGCIKMIGAVSICHYDFKNAHRSKFPIWNETAGVQVLCACAIPLPSSLSVCDGPKR